MMIDLNGLGMVSQKMIYSGTLDDKTSNDILESFVKASNCSNEMLERVSAFFKYCDHTNVNSTMHRLLKDTSNVKDTISITIRISEWKKAIENNESMLIVDIYAKFMYTEVTATFAEPKKC